MELVNVLFPWQKQPEISKIINVIAISLDETDSEITSYKQKMPQLIGWTHLRAPEGIRSKVASDYYILATPEMILLDAKTKVIISTPNSLPELVKEIN